MITKKYTYVLLSMLLASIPLTTFNMAPNVPNWKTALKNEINRLKKQVQTPAQYEASGMNRDAAFKNSIDDITGTYNAAYATIKNNQNYQLDLQALQSAYTALTAAITSVYQNPSPTRRGWEDLYSELLIKLDQWENRYLK